MRHEIKSRIKKDLLSTKKAVIAIGDSFTEGQGAVDQSLYKKYKFKYSALGIPMELDEPKSVKDAIVRRYSSVSYSDDGSIDFYFMENQNSYVNVLCRDYLRKKYTPVNLGVRGSGNRASIKSLHFHNDLDWDKLDNIIVIYCPTESSRFDFASDATFDGHSLFTTIWPHYTNMSRRDLNKLLWEGYAKLIYSAKSAIVEEIINLIDLQNWCKLYNATLIITPAFSTEYSKSAIESILSKDVIRDDRGVYDKEQLSAENDENAKMFMNLITSIDFDAYFRPDNCKTFIDLCLKQEGLCGENFYNYFGPGTPDHWITKCGHPSAKAHRLFAEKLYEHIIKLSNAKL